MNATRSLALAATLAASLKPGIAREIFGARSLLAWGPASPHGKAVADPVAGMTTRPASPRG